MRPVVEQHRGQVVKNIGDSYLCLFSAATDALKAGLGARIPDDDLPRRHNWQSSGSR